MLWSKLPSNLLTDSVRGHIVKVLAVTVIQRGKVCTGFILCHECEVSIWAKGPLGQTLSQFLYREKTRNISTSPLDEMLVQCRVASISKFPGTYFCTWVQRGTVTMECFAQEHDTGINPGLLDPERNTLSVRTPCAAVKALDYTISTMACHLYITKFSVLTWQEFYGNW